MNEDVSEFELAIRALLKTYNVDSGTGLHVNALSNFIVSSLGALFNSVSINNEEIQ